MQKMRKLLLAVLEKKYRQTGKHTNRQTYRGYFIGHSLLGSKKRMAGTCPKKLLKLHYIDP